VDNHLRHLLDELSAAIGRAKHREDREELARLRGVVEDRLAGAGEEEHPQEDESQSLLDVLEKAEIRFEADHPTLTESVRQAIQALSSAGI
jgi:phosphoglycolate phosphatase-like HAD superfamily hydrolase